MANVDDEIDKMAQSIMSELETAKSKDLSEDRYVRKILQLSDLHYTKRLLKEIEKASPGVECGIEKRAVIKALLLSTWIQRLYFIIRSFIMGLITFAITILYVSYFGTIGVTLAIILGGIVFVVSLAISRLFDGHIVKITKIIVERLASHKAVRDFIMNHF